MKIMKDMKPTGVPCSRSDERRHADGVFFRVFLIGMSGLRPPGPMGRATLIGVVIDRRLSDASGLLHVLRGQWLFFMVNSF
jgi:hypothetical protein